MTKMLAIGAMVLGLAIGNAQAQGRVSCEQEIGEINQFLSEQGMPSISDVSALASTIRYIDSTGRLPTKYITSDEAKRLGWSGRGSESLWGVKPTNQKLIGGDSYSNPSFPNNVPWLSADIDVAKGYRGNKRLVYSIRSPKKFITVNGNQHFVELSPCR